MKVARLARACRTIRTGTEIWQRTGAASSGTVRRPTTTAALEETSMCGDCSRSPLALSDDVFGSCERMSAIQLVKPSYIELARYNRSIEWRHLINEFAHAAARPGHRRTSRSRRANAAVILLGSSLRPRSLGDRRVASTGWHNGRRCSEHTLTADVASASAVHP
jgi:hypothetical protein